MAILGGTPCMLSCCNGVYRVCYIRACHDCNNFSITLSQSNLNSKHILRGKKYILITKLLFLLYNSYTYTERAYEYYNNNRVYFN